MDASMRLYYDFRPDLDMTEAPIEAKKKIHEYGFDSIGTVEIIQQSYLRFTII
jgi:hypothetical protein